MSDGYNTTDIVDCYYYDSSANNNGISNITQIGNDIVSKTDYDLFGEYIALSDMGNIVAIGAPHYNNNENNNIASGTIRVYELRNDNNDNNEWIQRGSNIEGIQAFELSGINALSGDGNIIAIGSPYNHNVNGLYAGKVRVFHFNGTEWVQMGNSINGIHEDDQFGSVLDISSNGKILAVGARRSSEGINYNKGQVRIYQYNNNTWELMGNNVINTDSYYRYSITQIAISLSTDGTILAIGEPHYNVTTAAPYAGRARIFQYTKKNNDNNDSWVQIGQDLYGNYTNARFGVSISLSSNGTVVAIGADAYLSNNNNNNIGGYVSMYAFQNNTWIPYGNKIVGNNPEKNFGNTISLSSNGKFLIVGNPYHNVNGYRSGRVRLYSYINDDWIQIISNNNDTTTILDGEKAGQEFGRSVAIAKDDAKSIIIFAIGGPAYPNYNNGIVKVFQINCGSFIDSITPVPTTITKLDDVTTTTTTSPTFTPTRSMAEPGSTSPGIFVSQTFVDVFIEYVGAVLMSNTDIHHYQVLTEIWYEEFFTDKQALVDLGVRDMRTHIVVTNQTVIVENIVVGIKVIYEQTITYIALDDNVNPEQYIYLPYLDRTENIKYGMALIENLVSFQDLVLPVATPQLAFNTENRTAQSSTKSSSNAGLIGGSIGAVIFVLLVVCIGGCIIIWIRKKKNANDERLGSARIRQSNFGGHFNNNHAARTDFSTMYDNNMYTTQSTTTPTTREVSVQGVISQEEIPQYKAQVRNDPVAIAEAVPFDT